MVVDNRNRDAPATISAQKTTRAGMPDGRACVMTAAACDAVVEPYAMTSNGDGSETIYSQQIYEGANAIGVEQFRSVTLMSICKSNSLAITCIPCMSTPLIL